MGKEFQSLAVQGKKLLTDILVASRNGDRKIMQYFRKTSILPSKKKEVEPAEPAHMDIYQSNTYRKALRWLHFDDEPRVLSWTTSEGPTVLHIHFCSLSSNSK